MNARPMFYLIDGHALAYRQFFGLPAASFSTSSGEVTNAVFGFTRTLLDILQKDRPKYLAVSFDMGLSGRDQLFAEYKGTREKMPPELESQLVRIEQVVDAFNIPVLKLEGYEADDVIGSVVPQAEAAGVDVRIITGDRDILQLLTPHVHVQLPNRAEGVIVYDQALFRVEYELDPTQLVDLKGLMGDSSDNIPGVRGIGQKTATKLLQQYGNIEGIYAHIDEIKGANRQKLVDGEALAYLSRDLATIRRDVPITLALPRCIAHDFDHAVVADLFRQLEFRALSDRLNEAQTQMALFDLGGDDFAPPDEADDQITTIIVDDAQTLNLLCERLIAASAIVWDVETTGIDQMAAELVGISLATDGETGYYIPVGHRAPDDLFAERESVRQLPLQTVLDALRGPLTDPNIPKYAHNAVYDLVMMQRYGVDVAPVGFDTMVAEWVRDPASKFLGLKPFVNQYLKLWMREITDLIGKGKKQITMDQVEIKRAAPYAAADAAMTYRAFEHLRDDLIQADNADLWTLFTTLEMPFIPVLAAMERAGVVLDTAHLSQLSRRLSEQLAALETQIYAESGYGTFNINSPKQLNDVLFGKLGLSVEGLKKTSHGYSTDAATLDNLRDTHPVVPLLLNYRELAKLKGTYVDALPGLINPNTGRLHTSYNQTGTSTGRLSSSNPNLQNIPIRTEVGREVRRAFVAPAGALLLSVDYSQIELRVLAHMSGDETLLEAFHHGQDIHAATAAAVYGIPLEAVTYDQRSFAKRVNFGLIYGMGAYRLARDSELSVGEARDFIETYFGRLPGVKRYLDETRKAAYEGPIHTLFGRRRVFPALIQAGESGNRAMIQGEERAAINMPIQGTAADIMKKAMIDLYHALRASDLRAQMILQVHDELLLEVQEDEIKPTRDLVVSVMETAYTLRAPLRANAEIGPNWRDMEPMD